MKLDLNKNLPLLIFHRRIHQWRKIGRFTLRQAVQVPLGRDIVMLGVFAFLFLDILG